MAIGDGVRRNITTVSDEERQRLSDAFIELNRRRYPGERNDLIPGGVTFWFKQDEIHQATHVHGGDAFIPWHRELCNRLEFLLREVDPQLSLHYWDWTTDPRSLFTPQFMGNHNGDAGEPWLSAGFYNPTADPFRDDSAFNEVNDHPFDPPRTLTRAIAASNANADGTPALGVADADIIAAPSYTAMAALLESAHNRSHGYIGGTILNGHTSFRDPFVYLLHSNVDRLFAMWQTVPGQEWRLDASLVYGAAGDNPSSPINENLEPWAGITPAVSTGRLTRPWAPPENRQVVKTSKDASVVAPPCYDTLPNVPPTIVLETTTVTFNDVPENEKTVRPVVFSVYACADVTFTVTDGPRRLTGALASTFELPLGGTVIVEKRAGYTVPKGFVWIAFRGTADGDVATGTIGITCQQTGEVFNIPITTETIARPRAAVALVLDRSNSMSFDGGDGRTRLQVLKDAAMPFVDKLQESNAVGMVAFDHDPHDVLPITVVGAPDDPTDAGRDAARTAITNHTHNPNGNTAIGDGVAHADALLAPVPAADFPTKAMIVLTDGRETASQTIAEVMPLIAPNQHIFAIGLGTPEEIQPASLAALADGHRGTLQMTGLLDQDDRYLLTKFYLQILANVTNEDIVKDPEDFIRPGQQHRIPFDLNETDISSDVVLLHPQAGAIALAVETPKGDLITPAAVPGIAGTSFVPRAQMTYYQILLPALIGGTPAHDGTWHAVLSLDERDFRKYLSSLDNQPVELRRARAHGIRYSLSVHAYSNLRLRARLDQSSYEPGASLRLTTTLSEYGLPVTRRAGVEAEFERPDGVRALLPLPETEPGLFEASVLAPLPGIYTFHVRARGVTLRNLAFTREQLLTGAVWRGGDKPTPPEPIGGNNSQREDWCRLVGCLISDQNIIALLKEKRIDVEGLRKCLDVYCTPQSRPPR